MFSKKSVGKHALFLLIDRIEGKEGRYTLYYIYKREEGQLGLAGFIGAAGFVGVVGVAWCGGYCRMWRVLQELSTEIKKKFFSFFTLTPSQMWLKRPVYRGFKGEGRCEGRAFTLTPTLTLPSHFRHRIVSCQGQFTEFNKSTRKVQLSGTDSSAQVYQQYSYAPLSVQLCSTISIAMLHLWCKGAALLPALLFVSLYSGFSGGRRTSFLHSIILNRPTADNSSLAFPSAAERCFFILHSSLLHGAL